MSDHPVRTVKSFVRRQGRLTDAQKAKLAVLDECPEILQPERVADLIAMNDRPIFLDVGFGMGDSLIALAHFFPEALIVGVEVYPAGVARALNLLNEHKIENVLIANFDVVELLELLPIGSLQGVQILYPDPWPKKRHHKRRLIQLNLLNQLHRLLSSSGWLHLVTDHQDYSDYIEEVLASSPFIRHQITGKYADYFSQTVTKYQRRAKRLHHDIHAYFLQKNLQAK